MPNKYVDDLKDDTDRRCGQDWQSSLDVDHLTSRKWNQAADMASSGRSDSEIRESILDNCK